MRIYETYVNKGVIMCFSATASFTSSAILACIGYASIKTAKYSKSRLTIAAIPCFFALQQFCEGITWLHLNGSLDRSHLTLMAQFIFLFIAYALWPVWIPFCSAVNEKNPTRSSMMWVLFLIGILAAYHNLYHMPPLEIVPKVVGHSIQYEINAPFYKKFIYILLILLPFFISSLRYMWLTGILCLISSFLTQYLYAYAFTSLWCFTSAIISCTIYFVLVSNKTQEAPTHSP